MSEYQKREFCKAKKCKLLDKIGVNEVLKEKCKKKCPYSAWEFHDWLQKNKFKIIRDV